MKFLYSDGTVYCSRSEDDPYYRVFLPALCYRPSCYNCSFRDKDRQADFTIADFWGLENVLPDYNDGKGVSFVTVHTTKAAAIFDELVAAKTIDARETDFESSIKGNPSYTVSSPVPIRRKKFLRAIRRGGDFGKVAEKYSRSSGLRKTLGKIRIRLLSLFRRKKA